MQAFCQERVGQVTANSFAGMKNLGPRIAFMASPGREYVEAMLATWLLRGIAVPLCQSHPKE